MKTDVGPVLLRRKLLVAPILISSPGCGLCSKIIFLSDGLKNFILEPEVFPLVYSINPN